MTGLSSCRIVCIAERYAYRPKMETDVIIGKLRKSGNSFIVTVPRAEVERLQLAEGQTVSLEVRPVEMRPKLSPELQEWFEAFFPKHEAALRSLVDR